MSHWNQYIGGLAYADDITLLRPSIKGLNPMLNTWNEFAIENKILFNCKKSICFEYGFKEIEIAKLGGIKIEMVKSVRHLGNYIDCTFNEQTDCKIEERSIYRFIK